MSNRLKEIIRGIVKEIQSEKELEEMTGTAAVAGYDTPNAFSKPGSTAKKNKRLANVTGGEVVDDLEEGITSSAGAPFSKPSDVAGKNAKLAKLSGATVVGEEKDWLKNDVPANSKKPLEMKPITTDSSNSGEIADKSGMILAKDDEDASLNENRWLAIKNEDGSPKAKMSKGISSIKQQLGEVEKFVNWYSKIKNENGVKRGDYYKRTNKSLHKIKERLMNLSEKIRTL
ncbi:MAG: hypothetical protein RIT11_1085 [Pseudomonadota bacterium]